MQCKTFNTCALSSTLCIYEIQHPHLIVRSLKCWCYYMNTSKHTHTHTRWQNFMFCFHHCPTNAADCSPSLSASHFVTSLFQNAHIWLPQWHHLKCIDPGHSTLESDQTLSWLLTAKTEWVEESRRSTVAFFYFLKNKQIQSLSV